MDDINIRLALTGADQVAAGATKAADGLAKLGTAGEAANSKQQKFLDSLREQATALGALGKSADDLARLRAAQLGVAEAAAPLILQLSNMRAAQALAAQTAKEEADAQRAAAAAKQSAAVAAQGFLNGLREQAEAIGKSRTELLELRAAQLGVADQAGAYIAKLKALEGGQQGVAKSAEQLAMQHQIAAVQVKDFFEQVTSGGSAMRAFAQQGAAVVSTYGGLGATFSALGTVFTAGRVLIAGVAGALALFGAAAHAGAQEAHDYEKALILTGNAAGQTAQTIAAQARSLEQFGTTQAKAGEALTLIATQGHVGAESLQKYTEAALALERAGGPAIAHLAKDFAELEKSPLEAARKLDEATNFLTVDLLKQIKALQDQGRTTDAARVAQDAYAASAKGMADKLEANLGTLEKTWRGIGDAAKWAWDQMLDVGRGPSVIDRLKAELENYKNTLAVFAASNGAASIGGFQFAGDRGANQDAAAAARAAADQAKAAELKKAWNQYEAIANGLLTQEEQRQREVAAVTVAGQQLVNAGKLKQVDLDTQIQRINAKFADKSGDNELATERAKLQAAQQNLALLLKEGSARRELTDGEKRALEIRQQLTNTLAANVRAEKERALAIATARGQVERLEAALKADIDQGAKFTEQLGQQADAIRQKALDQEAANAVYGQGKTAIEALTLAEAQKQARDLEATDNVDPKYLANLYAKIDAQKRYVDALKQSDFKQLSQGLNEQLRTVNEQLRLDQEDAQLASLTRVEREKVLAARKAELDLAKNLAEIDRSGLDEAQKDILRIQAREIAAKQSSAAINKVMRDDFDRTSDYIQQSLTDALVNGGKSAADVIKGIFRAMVLRPVVEAYVQPVASAASGLINGFLGIGSSPGGASAGGFGNLASLGSLFTDFGGSTVKGLSNIGAWLANNGFDSAASWLSSNSGTIGQVAGIGGDVLGYGNSLYALSQGKYASAAGSAIGTAFGGPVGAAIGSAIGSAIDKAFGSAGTPQHGASYLSSGYTGTTITDGSQGLDRAWGDSIGKYFSQPLQDSLKTITGTAANILNTFSQAFTGTAGYQVGAFFASDNNRDSQGNRAIEKNGQMVIHWSGDGLDSDPTKGLEQLTAALAGDVRDALRMIDIPGWARDQLDALGNSAGFDKLATTVQQILATQTALANLGNAMPQLAHLTDTAVTSLLGAFNGIDGLATAANSYYDNFYTAAEKNAAATQQLGTAMAALGFQVPTTRDAFRQLVEAQDLTTESGRAAYAGLLKLSPAFAALVPAAEAAAGTIDQVAQRMADAGKKALASLAEQQGALQVDLLKAQGDAAGAAALARQQALAKITDGLSAQDAAAATAAYDYNLALQQQIAALNAAATAAQQAAAADAARASQRDGLQQRIDELTGNIAAQRARELAALDPLNRDLQAYIYTLQDQQAAAAAAAQAAQQQAAAEAARANQRDGIQARIDDLTGNTAAIRARELAALDPLNQSLQQYYYTLLDQKTAADAAAQAAQALADKQRAIAGERDNIQSQIDQLTGDTQAIRARELAGLDESNRALKQHYYDLLDQQAATQAAAQAASQAAQAAQQQAQAAQQLRDAWKGVGDTLVDEVARIRGLGATPTQSLAQAQSQFAIATAQARAGDEAAAKALPNLSKGLLDLAGNNATSRAELERTQAQVAASLQTTASLLASRFGFALKNSAGGATYDVQALLSQVAATAPITNAAVAQQQATAATQTSLDALVGEVRALRAEVQALKAPADRTAAATERTRDVLTLVTDNGNAMQVEEAS